MNRAMVLLACAQRSRLLALANVDRSTSALASSPSSTGPAAVTEVVHPSRSAGAEVCVLKTKHHMIWIQQLYPFCVFLMKTFTPFKW